MHREIRPKNASNVLHTSERSVEKLKFLIFVTKTIFFLFIPIEIKEIETENWRGALVVVRH